ncbi:restriction endonuclease subunit S [uncultured Prevotella sp.]|uniref:restriction endonuclease subunit S n=1 Tax=uncultured Prevotella sp. TaxID=159272 RepID=UPI0025D41E63|nr:restriction endonuclease subunit S [uncultured Prevotella sp.]
MKQGWEYKKLGEVATFINGYAFKPDQWKEYGTPIVRIQNLNNPNAPYNYFDGEGPDKVKIQNGDLLISWSASLGAYIWNGGNAFLNQHIFKVAFDKTDVDKIYLKYAVTSKLETMAGKVHGATMKHIVKKDFDNTLIPYPPKSTQLTIVSELDKINELIRLKKEQLKDYDNLAQSIFYEMFGDPVENDKGWEVKKLGDVCDIFAGGDKPKDIKTTKDNEYIYPVIANGEGKKGILGYSKKCRVIKNAVTIGARGASIGNCRIVKDGFTPAIRLLTLIPSEKLDCPFLFYIVKGLDYKQNGAGQAQLTVPNIKNERIILPPLPLQHLFAQRIEQIERQKPAVQKSITDLETILASRMQYWFE